MINLPFLQNVDYVIDTNSNKIYNVPEHHLIENDVQSLSKYYTFADFSANFRSFKGLSMIHYNVRSLGANMLGSLGIKESLSKFLFIFDIVAVTETWTKANSHYNLCGYTLIFNYILHKDGGGVALFINNKIELRYTLKCNKLR